MAVTVVETEVVGSPAALREQARWLRRTAAGDLDAAGGWDGEAGSAYQDVGALALRITDDHAARVRRAAAAVDDVADRLAALRRTMAGFRDEALAGGLLVLGTRITMPLTSLLGGPERDGFLGGPASAEQRLLDRIDGDVRRARRAYDAWVEGRMARAQQDAAERGDLDGVLRRMEPAPGPVAPPPTAAADDGSGLAGPAPGATAASAPAPAPAPVSVPGPAGPGSAADWAVTPGPGALTARYAVADHPRDDRSRTPPPRTGPAADPGRAGGVEPVELGDVRQIEPPERYDVLDYGRPPERDEVIGHGAPPGRRAR